VRASIVRVVVGAPAVLLLVSVGLAGPPALITILSGELDRNFRILRQQASPPPYFISYSVTEEDTFLMSAGLGALETDTHRHDRRLDVTVRVGSPALDSYHPLGGQRPRFTRGVAIALENNPNAIRQAVWRETDRVYRLAAQRLINIRTDQRVKVEEKDAAPDFSSEEPVVDTARPPEFTFDREQWARRLRKISAGFAEYPGVLRSRVVIAVQRQTKYLVNTEGTRLTHGSTIARLQINGAAKAPDGMDLTASESFEAVQPDALPPDDVILEAVRRVATDLSKLIDAPVVDPYVAPAILSGRAAGVFFHEIFGHRVEGHRQKDVTEGQTFTNSVGAQVLPEFLSVIFDPTRRRLGETALMGWYRYDDEGVKARRVPVVENGVLKTFLMSRSPIRGFSKSNGHGRRQTGREVVSRQSNLFVESEHQVPEQRLREMLLEEIQRQKRDYGFYFEEVTGGFTLTARRGVEAFKVIPLIVYRVYPDGRPDELVRGADIVGTPLAAFTKIIATGDTPGISNGFCGAESGNVPVAAVSPALLVSEIEIQRKRRSQARPPLLPRPFQTEVPR